MAKQATTVTVPESDRADENSEFGYEKSNWHAGSMLSTSEFQTRVQDGRTYAVYGKEEYGFPMDDEELERIDLCHVKYHTLLHNKRFLAPLAPHPQRVLDLGCGTGIWSIDFADAYPSAEVIGIDIAPTQPEWVPPNCRFEIFDVEQPWTWKKESFDFIFARDLVYTVRDYPKLIDQIFQHLKPGGWVEFQSITGILQCDDESLRPDSPLREFSDRLEATCQVYRTSREDPLQWTAWFAARGFVNAAEHVFRVPCSPWPRDDERQKLVGAFEMDNLLRHLRGMSMRPFRRAFGWSADEVEAFIGRVEGDVRDSNVHAYWPFYVSYAQKPPSP